MPFIVGRPFDALQLVRERDAFFAELQRTKEQYRRTFEEAPIGIANADRHGAIVQANRRLSEIFGCAPQEIHGRRFSDLSHPDDREVALALEERVLAGREAKVSFLHRCQRRDDSIVWVQATLSRMQADEGLTRMIVLVEDVSDSRAAAEQLATAQRIARVGSWEHDLISCRRRWSDELFRICGLPVGETPALADFFALVHADDREILRDRYQQMVECREPLHIDFRIVLPGDGSERWLAARAHLELLPDGRPAKIVGVAQDITETKRAEDELRRMAVQQSAVANLGQLALAGASVDFLTQQARAYVADFLGLEQFTLVQVEDAGAPARAALERGIIVIDDLRRETRIDVAPELLESGYVSGMIVAVTAGPGEPWGAISAWSRTHRIVTTADADFFRALAMVIGQAVERTRADHALRIRALQQSAIAELGRIALSVPDRGMVERVCSQVRGALGVDEATFLPGQGIPLEISEYDMAVPVASAGTTYGTFLVLSHRPRTYDDADVHFLQSVANVLAEALEREDARRALVSSEESYRAVVEGASEVIFTIKPDGTITALNNAFEGLTGWPREEWLNRRLRELAVARDTDRVRKLVRQSVTGRHAVASEITIDGKYGPMLVALTAFPRVVDGEVTAVYGFLRDITESRRAEEERDRLTRNLQLLLESTVEGIFATDLEGRCTLVNRAAEQLLGRSSDELIGACIHDLIDFAEVVRTGDVISMRDGTFFRSDGTPIPVEYSAAPIIDRGTMIGVVVTFSDVTLRRRLEAKLEQANRVAGLGRLAATVAHEFNNVLMGISPFVEVIRRGSSPERVAVALDHIARAIQRGKRVTSDILRFTQPAEPTRTSIDVYTLLGALAVEARSMANLCQIELDVHDHELRIDGDANQIHQIMTNLILNARDAMPHGGRLTITARRNGRFVQLSVSDTGSGMTPETLKHVFEPLFTTKRNGTGLGLSVVHQIVMRHDGEITVESTPGVGTTFHLHLPLAAPPAPLIETETAVPLPPRSKVLLVEDDASVSEGLASLLELENMEVEVVETGAAALAAVRTSRPDVVVLDVGLPDMDGRAVYDNIATLHPHLPVIFSTGHGDRSRFEDLLTRPTARFLLKPYESSTLLSAITDVA